MEITTVEIGVMKETATAHLHAVIAAKMAEYVKLDLNVMSKKVEPLTLLL